MSTRRMPLAQTEALAAHSTISSVSAACYWKSSLGAYNLYAKRASFKDDVVFQQFLLDKPEETPVAAVPVIEQALYTPLSPEFKCDSFTF
ncbi:uncharacterized protein DEA37_0002327 [Paragonimus westermani]|uniref:Uncharacterized protein n=1 Tax=Paragonimus westermani TaxID=34504 RepID=A0A5J4NJZ9_9TREM|nr:uncharacterized protein DEA37_0002327 [Paragonimus westermani]